MVLPIVEAMQNLYFSSRNKSPNEDISLTIDTGGFFVYSEHEAQEHIYINDHHPWSGFFDHWVLVVFCLKFWDIRRSLSKVLNFFCLRGMYFFMPLYSTICHWEFFFKKTNGNYRFIVYHCVNIVVGYAVIENICKIFIFHAKKKFSMD